MLRAPLSSSVIWASPEAVHSLCLRFLGVPGERQGWQTDPVAGPDSRSARGSLAAWTLGRAAAGGREDRRASRILGAVVVAGRRADGRRCLRGVNTTDRVSRESEVSEVVVAVDGKRVERHTPEKQLQKQKQRQMQVLS